MLNWKPLKYHPAHAAMWNTNKRFVAAVAGRQSGKTELARRKIVYSLGVRKPWPDPVYIYALPTFNQAKKIAWKEIIKLVPRNWLKRNGINVTDMSIETIFGSTLYVVGMDKPYRIEGLTVDGIVVDESSDQKPKIFDLTLRPMLAVKKGWMWRIGVPKRNGIGRIDFKEFFMRGLKGDPDILSVTWKSADILDPVEMFSIKSTTSKEDFEEQYEAVWLDGGGTIYYAFSDDNVKDDLVYDPNLPLMVGCDFNVDPMAWVVGQKHLDSLHVLDELFIRNTNTENTMKRLMALYPEHRRGWRFYGDASSLSRKTSSTKTDYVIIKNFNAPCEIQVFFPHKNPKLRERHAHVNALLCNALDIRRLYIHSRCKHLISDLKVMSYIEGTTDVENYEGTDIGHISDALGYLIVRVFPMKLRKQYAPQILSLSS